MIVISTFHVITMGIQFASLGVSAWSPKAINISYTVAPGECSY